MDDTSATTPDAQGLFAQATDQAGYFTSAQARAYGYSRQLLSYHAERGRFIRLRRGLYRMRDYPSSQYEEVMAAWLAVGKDQAVVSHESALDLLGLSDVLPDRVHLTVPRSRRGIAVPSGAILHTTMQALPPNDTMTWNGMRVTVPTRSILDAAEYGAGPEQIVMAIRQATERGLILPDTLRGKARDYGARVARLADIALDGG